MPEPTKARRVSDPELITINVIAKRLNELTADERRRVVTYIMDRYASVSVEDQPE